MKLSISVEQGKPVPQAGSTFSAQGLAGIYTVEIQKIISETTYKDGTTVLQILGKKILQGDSNEQK